MIESRKERDKRVVCGRIGSRCAVCFLIAFAGVSVCAQGTAIDSGARQYGAYCAGCHGADGSGSAKGAAIATLARVIEQTDAQLIVVVHDGVPGKGMPGFAQLGDEDARAVVRYLRVLQRNEGAQVGDNAEHAGEQHSMTGLQAHVQTANAATLPEQNGHGVADLDVQPGELNQKEVRENWVSYNGDYSGRRYQRDG